MELTRGMHDWGPLVGDLKARKERALGMGGADRVERQHSLGKLTVRERLDLLLDPGTWVEYGLLADHMDAGIGDRYLAADGAVTGVGEIDGRPVAVAAYDFTVMAGSMGAVGEDKIARMRERAVRQRIPMIWLLDSAAARIQSTSGATFAGAGALFREQVAMSGVVPMVAAMLGPCAAGTAYIPALADFVPMVKGTSSMALGGRHLVSGGGRGGHRGGDGRQHDPHRHLGCRRPPRRPTTTDASRWREYLSYMPSQYEERAPRDPHRRPARPARRGAGTRSCPATPRGAYDMRRVI